jgi:hypothetical protein
LPITYKKKYNSAKKQKEAIERPKKEKKKKINKEKRSFNICFRSFSSLSIKVPISHPDLTLPFLLNAF